MDYYPERDASAALSMTIYSGCVFLPNVKIVILRGVSAKKAPSGVPFLQSYLL
jgi:hypothetical protein